MRKCSVCGDTKSPRIINSKIGSVCGKCYQRNRNYQKEVHKLPEYGEISYDNEGDPICHICGKSYKKLMGHVRHQHEMTAYEYKKEFGLETSKGILNEELRVELSNRVKENYEKCVNGNLLERGKDHRYAPGGVGRVSSQVSAQTHKKLKARLMELNKERAAEWDNLTDSEAINIMIKVRDGEKVRYPMGYFSNSESGRDRVKMLVEYVRVSELGLSKEEFCEGVKIEWLDKYRLYRPMARLFGGVAKFLEDCYDVK